MSDVPAGDGPAAHTPGLVEHFFRREYARLVAVLVRRVGARHLGLVEDAVQSALSAALSVWTREGRPNDPAAWLYQAAHNHLIGDLRRQGRRNVLLAQAALETPQPATPPAAQFEREVQDDLLRMLFICCDPSLPHESQLMLALKTLCGFNVAEIALRLFTSEANVYKRLARARARLRREHLDFETPQLDTLRTRLPTVRAVLYLLFNEGYLSAREDEAIRRELCEEAIRLATLLAEHDVGAEPETFALLALMHLHAARLGGRVDMAGGLLLLEEQDRSQWNEAEMQSGYTWLARSASGRTFSRYHAEAGIAAAHVSAESFETTPWGEVADLYAALERLAPSPLHTLNRAVAVAEWQGPVAGLAVLESVTPPAWLESSYLWDAVLADLHRRAGHDETAAAHRDRALASAPSRPIRILLERRFSMRRY